MKRNSNWLTCIVTASLLASIPAAFAKKQTPQIDLSWLAGSWHGTFEGTPYQETYSTVDGGTVLWTGKIIAGGKVVFFEFGTIDIRQDGVYYTPYPSGKKSDSFRLVEHTSAPLVRLVFENTEHDFPTRFTHELLEPNRLRITLSGPEGEGGKIQVVELTRR